jgi:hypothetical protein
MQRSIELPERWIAELLSFPEAGMGYQLVKVILKNGKTLSSHKVINASLLLLNEHDHFRLEEIEGIIPSGTFSG